MPSPSLRPYLRVGLTGGIASGKSTVARYFSALGACVIDADRIAHAVLEPGGGAFQAVVDRFGPEILDAQGSIVRSRLGEMVFSDPEGLTALNAIVHPEVRALSNQHIADCAARPGVRLIVYDAALLIETGTYRDFDRLVVTSCSPATQLARIMQRDGLREPQAQARIDAQSSLEEKLDLADYVIDTEGTEDDARLQTQRVYEQLIAELDGPDGDQQTAG